MLHGSHIQLQSLGSGHKDIDKCRQKSVRADMAMQTADLQYKEAVAQLEEARVLWEREMVSVKQFARGRKEFLLII